MVTNRKPRRLMKQHDDRSGGGAKAVDRPFKHIFLGIDGTWQAAYSDMFYSNVFRMNVALNYEDKSGRNPQVFIYSSGLGTSNPSARIAAGALGEGLDESILQAYINIVSNYAPGDKLYIFGFSRGAVAARALTGFITYSGLLKANSASLIEHAWRYFTGKDPTIDYPSHREANTHHDVMIDFLGVWDTVSGPYKKDELLERYRFDNLALDPSVRHGVHIVSIDDSRMDFAPLLWSGPSNNKQVLEQIWMPGVHADIGGGYNHAFLSTVSLLTMIDKLAECNSNLSFDESYIERVLLPIAEKEDIVINDEWKHYVGRLLKRRKRHRRRVDNVDVSNHSAHPLTKFIRLKEITIREVRDTYEPSFQLLNNTGVLENAKFAANSWYLRKLEAILSARLGTLLG